MSQKGIRKFASAMEFLQQTRQELLDLGDAGLRKKDKTSAKQDIYLAQLLDEAKDVVKERFMECTLGRRP